MKDRILEYCKEKGILLDSFLLDFFSGFENLNDVFIIVEEIHKKTNKRFFSKGFVFENISIISDVLSDSIKNKFKGLIEETSIAKNKSKNHNVRLKSSFCEQGRKIELSDFVNFFKGRYKEIVEIMQKEMDLSELMSINRASGTKQGVSLVGMIFNKNRTKNGNIILEIEDLSGSIKILINSDKKDLFNIAENLCLDSVIGIRGVAGQEIIFADKIIFPEINLSSRKKSSYDESVAFIGDIHFGSKKFLKDSFESFINYLSDANDDVEARKIKYLFIVGDIVTGIGNYPNQKDDLLIMDLKEQFSKFAEMLKRVRKDISIIITSGNHDCVRIMEPQPVFNRKYAEDLYNMNNVFLIENPSIINIGDRIDFSGFDILCYHGFSFPYYANNVNELLIRKSMNEPDLIMKYLLKNRHLAPTHGSLQYFPSKRDPFLIREAPDFFVSGHTHKSTVSYFNNIMLVSVSSWEAETSYQKKFGNDPDFCKVPVVNLKTRDVQILDFEVKDDSIKFYEKKRGQYNIENKKIKIGIDLDDVIFEFAKEYFKLVERKYGEKKEFSEITTYSFWEILNITKEQSIDLAYEIYNSEMFSSLELVENVKENLEQMFENMEIYFITSRDKSTEEKTRKNLELNFPGKEFNIIFSGDFFGGNKTKSEICEELGVKLMIEDNLTYAKSCADKGVKCILLNKPWNQENLEHDNIIRVENWNEILKEIGMIENE